jgi:hypothetical protein
MSSAEMTFVEKCLAGEALIDDIDDYVDRWHEGEGNPDASLAQFLGFTDLEYRLWAEKPNLLPFILNAKRRGVSLANAQNYDESYRLAARDLPVEDVEELTQWLKSIGEIPS